MIKVAVTGATGFIGRRVLTELARHPVEVIAVARRWPADLPDQPQRRFVQLDMENVSSGDFSRLGKPDILLHLAWGGLPNYGALHHFEHELPIQYKFLRALVQAGLGSIVVSGTCLEYGLQSGPLNEEVEPRPSNPYGFAKDTLRRQLEFLKTKQQFTLTWARLFYIYGEGQSETSLLPQLKGAVERREVSFNMSGGEQLRDYLPVTDVARYLVALALARKDVGVVNVCSGKPISIRNLVEGWVKENNWSIALNLGYYSYTDYEPLAYWGTRTKLDSSLGLLSGKDA